MQVVWFKRDLRIADHRPLVAACRSNQPVLCLCIIEPQLWQQPDADARHLHFIRQSLEELSASLVERGGRLVVRIGSVVDVLAEVHSVQSITRLHSHEETGTLWTYERDKQVAHWCRENQVIWSEQSQNGVIRRLRDRDGWARHWHRRMQEPLQPAPTQIDPAVGFSTEELPIVSGLQLTDLTEPDNLQSGGESAARETLKSFLKTRGNRYHLEMSSPVTAWTSCSRLSSHLAWGTISVRQVYQSVMARIRTLRNSRLGKPTKVKLQLDALQAYQERLHWHCHFMQKLEDQPDLEDVNMHRACDGLRPEATDDRLFEAWKTGRTGYPLVDACMRAVLSTGWLNFRMRAMVVSFASYHLWIDWRPTSRWLARMFTDYEPGIHFNQFQMQSGTTGISTVRIYNPVKQVHDQDPTGIFIRRWVPELLKVPDEFIAEPHRMPAEVQEEAGCIIRQDYPQPIVDNVKAIAAAQKRMRRVRQNDDARQESRRVFKKHGSRRRRFRR